MSSPAIHYKGKVFAFFSRKNKMVFKLGKSYPIGSFTIEVLEFSPFKTKKALAGWYEVDYMYNEKWEILTRKALEHIKNM